MDIKLTLSNEQLRSLRNNESINVTLTIGSELRDDCREITMVDFITEFLPTETSYKDLATKCGLSDGIFNKMYNNHRDGLPIHIPRNKTLAKIMNELGVRILEDDETLIA